MGKSQTLSTGSDFLSRLDLEEIAHADRGILLDYIRQINDGKNEWLRRAVLAGRDDILAKEILGYTIVPQAHGRMIAHQQKNRESLLIAYPGSGKALSLDTALPTPCGWTTMGDVAVGDVLFDERGLPCRVTFATDVLLDRECYEITFSDETKIVADADHLWLTEDQFARMEMDRPGSRLYSRPIVPLVRTTSEIAKTVLVYDKHNHIVRVTQPLVLPERRLPIAPYTLGAWLGDGHSDGCAITCVDEEILANIGADGYQLRRVNLSRAGDAPRYSIVGLTTALRGLGVLGHKHIPDIYLRASASQRRDLLAGLMDTDGYAAPDGREVEFCTIRKDLADQVFELAVSLGFKPRIGIGRAKLYEKDCGPKYRVLWQHRQPIFRLSRKASNQSNGKGQAGKAHRRYIIAVTPVPSVPVRCIQVDSPSHLYLCSRAMIPTHNTTATTVTRSIGMLLRNPNRTILLASKSQGNAEGMLSEIKGHFETNETLREIFGDMVGDSKWDTGAISVRGANPIRKEPSINTVGLGGAIASKHYDVIFADDLVDQENTMTPASRQKTWDWVHRMLDTRLNPPDPNDPEVGQKHFINTLFHWDDLPNRLKKILRPEQILIIPVVDNKGRYAWPSRHTSEWVTDKREKHGLINFGLQYLCTAEVMKGAVFQYDDCHQIPIEQYPKAKDLNFYMGIDLAISQQAKADKFAIVVIGRSPRHWEDIYVWAAWEGHLTFAQQTDLIIQWAKKYRPVRTAIEANAYQAAQYQTVRTRAPFMNLRPVTTLKNKITRAWRRAADFEATHVHFAMKRHTNIIDHLVLFKGDGTTPDDLFDAFDLAVSASESKTRRSQRAIEPGVI